MTYLSFPGLGIEPFRIKPEAIELSKDGGFDIMWYGVLIALGMILAFLYALSRAKIEGIKTDDIYDLGIFAILFGVIGARLYYVIFEFGRFYEPGNIGKTLLNIISIRGGGLAIYGGILGGFFTILVVSHIKRIRFSTLLDVVSPAVMIGQIIGRWGNFINIEAFGGETTLPWRMGILQSFDNGETFYSETYVHPTFLYESLWNLIGFILIAIFYKKKKFNGQVFLFYMTWYGFGRMLIEGLRTDSLMLGSFRVSQALAAVTFAVGLVLTVVNFVNLKRFNALKSESENSEEKSADVTSEEGTQADDNISSEAIFEETENISDSFLDSDETK